MKAGIKMRTRKGIVIAIAAGGAAFLVLGLKTKWAGERATRNRQDLRSLHTRVNRLEEDMELLDTRTDSMEFDMKYNVKRMADYDVDIDNYYDDEY